MRGIRLTTNGVMLVAIGLLLTGAALAATWHGTRADVRGLTKAIERLASGDDHYRYGPGSWGCYTPRGYERLVDVGVSNNQRERNINYVALASQRPPPHAQGCEIIFEHVRGGRWHVLSFGTSPCD